MKTMITAFAMVAIFAACNSNPNMGDQKSRNVNQADLSASNSSTDRTQIIETEAINDGTEGDLGKITSGSFKDQGKVVEYEVYKPEAKVKTVAKTSKSGTTAKVPAVSGNKATGNSTASAPVAQTQKKKGWSSAAKGTAIGAGSGAILGAVISKKKGKGAIIGGVIGAAGGYVIGRAKDKKDGRY